MKDILFKLRLLFVYHLVAIDEWKREVWDKDPDALFCCNGRDCMCEGMSVREAYSSRLVK